MKRGETKRKPETKPPIDVVHRGLANILAWTMASAWHGPWRRHGMGHGVGSAWGMAKNICCGGAGIPQHGLLHVERPAHHTLRESKTMTVFFSKVSVTGSLCGACMVVSEYEEAGAVVAWSMCCIVHYTEQQQQSSVQQLQLPCHDD